MVKSDEWHLGFESLLEGMDLDENPNPANTEDYKDWADGWEAAAYLYRKQVDSWI